MKNPYLQSLICSTSPFPWFDVQFITKGEVKKIDAPTTVTSTEKEN